MSAWHTLHLTGSSEPRNMARSARLGATPSIRFRVPHLGQLRNTFMQSNILASPNWGAIGFVSGWPTPMVTTGYSGWFSLKSSGFPFDDFRVGFHVVREHHDHFAVILDVHKTGSVERPSGHLDDGSFGNHDCHMSSLALRYCHCGAAETKSLAILHCFLFPTLDRERGPLLRCNGSGNRMYPCSCTFRPRRFELW